MSAGSRFVYWFLPKGSISYTPQTPGPTPTPTPTPGRNADTLLWGSDKLLWGSDDLNWGTV